jgi:hypothetical protein
MNWTPNQVPYSIYLLNENQNQKLRFFGGKKKNYNWGLTQGKLTYNLIYFFKEPNPKPDSYLHLWLELETF